MQNSSFEDNLRFFKDKLSYQTFYDLFKNKNNFSRFEVKEDEKIIEVESKGKFYIKFDKEMKQDLSKSKLAVFTSLLSFIIFSKQSNLEPELSIIFLEDLSFLGEIFQTFNLNEIIKNKEKIFLIKFISDIDYLINFLSQNPLFLSEPAANIKLEKYDEILGHKHSTLLEYFAQKFNELLTDYATHFIMLPKQIINTIENLKYIQNTLEICHDDKIFTLVVSAGPSLNKSIELIKKIEKSCYIIVVDTALKILLKNNIEPDLIIALDPQTLNFLDFLGITDLKNSILAVEISCTYKIPEKYKNHQNLAFFTGLLPATTYGEKNSFLPVNPLSKFISKTLSLCKIPIFGNVGLAAISFASEISDNIILSGFDNSFDSLVYHCKETIDINYYLKRQDYLNPALSKLNLEALILSYGNKKRKSSILEKNENIFNKNFPDKRFINIADIDIDFLLYEENKNKEKKYNENECNEIQDKYYGNESTEKENKYSENASKEKENNKKENNRNENTVDENKGNENKVNENRENEKKKMKNPVKIKKIKNIFYEKNDENYNKNFDNKFNSKVDFNSKIDKENFLRILIKSIDESFNFFEKSKEESFFKIENRLKQLHLIADFKETDLK